MDQDDLNATAIFLLRVALGTMFIAHSLWLKLFIFTLAGTASFFESIGLPGSFAYVVFTAEAVGGILLVLGVQARWVALMLAPWRERLGLTGAMDGCSDTRMADGSILHILHSWRLFSSCSAMDVGRLFGHDRYLVYPATMER